MDQVKAHFGGIEELAGRQQSHIGDVEQLRAQLKSQVSQLLANVDGGMGQDEHHRCMQQADRLIDEHISNLNQYKGATTNANQTFMAGGKKAQAIFGSGA